MKTKTYTKAEADETMSEARKDYDSAIGMARWWQKDGAWHIALPCADPDPETGLRTGGYRYTDSQYDSREAAIRAIKTLS